ncbi:MAG: FAD-dependent oxidoreductase [Kiritimatiellae bacterium]|nr:FAD-dependent oxidoreductase [Kiritimatiellia bacterium]
MKLMTCAMILAMTTCGFAVDLAEKPVDGTLEGVGGFRKPMQQVKMVVPGFLWVEAEDFDDYGAWKLDTQFVHKMGSAYLLAVGVGEPIPDASAKINVPHSGKYRVWVRALDWLPEFSPGKFTIEVNGFRSAKILGASKREKWGWESAGELQLNTGENSFVLKDMSGAFGRCDAIILTTDLAYLPPEDHDATQKERARLTGVSFEVDEGGKFDVIVVGAGAAGCSAAISAARMGAKTALIQDRPVLGGNSSIELGVGTDGASVSKANARETGIVEEGNLIRVKKGQHKMSAAYQELAAAEPNLTVFFNTRVINAEKNNGNSISAVIAVNTLTLKHKRFAGKLFVDCTGDGWVGYYAGAEYRFGREASREFDEAAAPEKADSITMSGCLMGDLALGYRAQDAGRPVDYNAPPWAVKLLPPEEFHRHPRSFVSGQWWLEHPGSFNDLEDPERCRDELIRISFAYWEWIKKHSSFKEAARNYAMTYVPYIDARRETRRLVGDYIMTQQDAEAGVMFPDRIGYGGWSLDVHNPKGIHSGKEGPYEFDGRVPLYSIPFRSLYSVNIDNLLFAGRHVSVTHIALGTVRVQATLSVLGQAAGTAAAMCSQRDITPRTITQRYITDLQQQLLRDDCYIPELKNEDHADLARTAKLTASSVCAYDVFDKSSYQSDTSTRHPLNMNRAVMFRRGIDENIGEFYALLENVTDQAIKVKAHLRGSAENKDYSAKEDLAVAETTLTPGRKYVKFSFNKPVKEPFIWFLIPGTPGVEWELKKSPRIEGSRAYSGSLVGPWTAVPSQQYAAYLKPGIHIEENYIPASVIDGVARIVGNQKHCWVSDPEKPLPQWIELDFGKATELSSVRLTFDTELNSRFPPAPVPKECVRDYRVSILKNNTWVDVAVVKGNFMRHCVHNFDATKVSKLRLTVEATNGHPSARVFEIRAY